MTERIKPGPKGPHKHPLLVKKSLHVKLPAWLLALLKQQDNQSALIEQLLLKHLKVKPPCLIKSKTK